MSQFDIASAVDVGCGQGEWLGVLEKEFGVKRVCGIDGQWIQRNELRFDASQFIQADLANSKELVELRAKSSQEFDLAISLEVGEHLPKEVAETYVVLLTSLAPLVLFSAAAPMQGGWNHINEQWPEYWRELFARCGYRCADVIRPLIWDDPDVLPHYRQNLLLFHSLAAGDIPARLQLKESEMTAPLARIHPANWELWHSQLARKPEISGRQALVALKRAVSRKVFGSS
jgi:SAM-dependent methyltransferase